MSRVRDSSNCMPSTILVPDRDKALHIDTQSLFSIFRNSIMSRHDTHAPETPATRFLRQHGMAYSSHLYDYEDHGGTAVSARELNVNEHAVIKTLIMEDENAQPLIVLMHGDRKVSTKNLARQIGAKSVEPCTPEVAQRHSGYLVGGTSPFGTRRDMPVYIEESILQLPRIAINGGRRGYLVQMDPQACVRLLGATPVQCALVD